MAPLAVGMRPHDVVGPLDQREGRLTAVASSAEGGAARPPATVAATATAPAASIDDLQVLIREHGDAVYRVALSVVRHRQHAEDVAQESMVKAWQSLGSYRGEAPLRNWLLRITHNTAVSSLRRRREEPADPALLPEGAGRPTKGRHLGPAPTPETIVEGRAVIDDFQVALGRLDELSRSIVVLRDVEGLAYEEISELLSVPLPTVKTRLLRARRLLATTLKDWKA